ncbi:MAG: hypothetical protein ACI4NJ_00810 [Cellvibrio sp.]
MSGNNNYKGADLGNTSIVAIHGQAAGQNIENHFHHKVQPEADEQAFFELTGLRTSAPERIAYRLILSLNINTKQLKPLIDGFHVAYCVSGKLIVRPNKIAFAASIAKILFLMIVAYIGGSFLVALSMYPKIEWWQILIVIGSFFGFYGFLINRLKKYYFREFAIYFKAKYLHGEVDKLNNELMKKFN